MSTKPKPYVAQGQALREKMGGRKLRVIAADLEVSIGRLQHWLAGNNRPDPEKFPAVNRVFSVDCTELYGIGGAVKKPKTKMVRADAIAPILDHLERQLQLLRLLVGKTPSSRKLVKRGFSAKGKDKAEREII